MGKTLWFRSIALYIILVLAFPLPVLAQEGRSEAAQQESQQKRFSQEELAQLLAPIALYPDELLSQVLIASTYPLEIVAADRWVQKNSDLKGDALARALEEEDWDPSVKSLVNFPSVLTMMSQKLEITSKLGDAFLAQEADVMATVQMLRKKAVAAGNLKSSAEQKVVVEEEAVIIEPVTPDVVYVPVYDPLFVYGPWFYPAYPPYPYYYYPLPVYGYFAFATAITIGVAWGYAWGGCNWHTHTVHVDVFRHRHIGNRFINHSRYIRYYERRGVTRADGRGVWRHDPAHRRGVAYRDVRTADRFGQSPSRVTRSPETRGFVDVQGAGTGARIDRRAPGRVSGEQKARPKSQPGGNGKISVPERRRDSSPAPGDRREPSTGVRTVPSGVGRAPAVAPKRDSAFSGGFRDGAGARSASERGRSSREFSRGGGRHEGGGGGRGGGSRR